MKRILSIIMCIALLALPLTQALAAQGDLIVARSENGPLDQGLEGYCGAGDALYFLLYGSDSDGSRTLGVHHAGETQMRKYALSFGEETEENGYESYESIRLLSDGERVYALREITFYGSGDDMDVQQDVRDELYEITIDGENVKTELICEPDWSIFCSDGGYYYYIESMVCVGDYLVMQYYDDSGMMRCTRMTMTQEPSFSDCAIDGEIVSLTLYTQGRVLIEKYTDDSYRKVGFVIYDPATDECEEMCELSMEQYGGFKGLACDLESGAVYYTKEGEIFELDLRTGESGEAITDMPGTMYSNGVCSILRGGYYASAAFDCYIFRNLNPEQKPTQRLKVYDSSYDDDVAQAFYTFSNEHGDVSAVLSRDYSSENGLVEGMMNRSGDIDVYIIGTDSSEYQAVFDRGYMMELTDSEKMREIAERMYPAVREELSINGELCALPVSCYFWLPFVNKTALEKLDMTIDDIPTNWSDFLDFLMELPERLPEDGSVALMDCYIGDTSAKRALFERIFESYQQLLQKDPNAFTAEQMAQLLEKLEAVDFRALGQFPEEETESDDFALQGADYYLLEVNMGTSLDGITNGYYPLAMALTEDTPRMLTISATVAFVNPFSENRELALEYMETLAENLRDSVEYAIFSDKTEPVENKYYQSNMEQLQKSLEALREKYESAEEADKQALKEQLDSTEEGIRDYEKYRYSITEDDIAWIHQYADMLTLQGNNWLYSSDSGDAYQLVMQYCDGQIDAKKLMDEIGRKIRMMLMEGY